MSLWTVPVVYVTLCAECCAKVEVAFKVARNPRRAHNIDLSKEEPSLSAEVNIRLAEQRKEKGRAIIASLVSMLAALTGTLAGAASVALEFFQGPIPSIPSILLVASIAAITIIFILASVYWVRLERRRRRASVEPYSVDRIEDENLKKMIANIASGQAQFARLISKPLISLSSPSAEREEEGE